MTKFLKFQSEAQAIELLVDFRNEGEWITYKDGVNIDIVGTIYKPTGVMLTGEEGMKYPEMAPLDGFHVNWLGELPAALAQYAVTPVTPSRVFA